MFLNPILVTAVGLNALLSFGGLVAGYVDRDNESRKALGEEEQLPIGLGDSPLGAGSGFEFDETEEEEEEEEEITALNAVLKIFQGAFADCGMDLESLMGMAGEAGEEGPGDPSAAMDFLKLSPACTASEQQSMRQAFLSFAECTGYDELLLDEDVFGALLGVAMKCVSSMTAMDMISMNIPEDCAIALFGNHPLGKMLRDELLFPGKTDLCFSTLADNVPQCSVDLWPFPVDGTTVRKGACLDSKLEKLWTEQCLQGLKDLQNCLPAVSEITSSNCSSYSDACVETGESYFVGIVMSLPQTLLGMPLPDSCMQQASPKGLSSAVDQYEAFRTSCGSTGKALWERLKAPEDDPKDPSLLSFAQFLGKDSNKSDSGKAIGESTEALQSPQLGQENPNGVRPGRSSGGFFGGGVLTGVLLMGCVFGVALYFRKKNRIDGAPGFLELSPSYNNEDNSLT